MVKLLKLLDELTQVAAAIVVPSVNAGVGNWAKTHELGASQELGAKFAAGIGAFLVSREVFRSLTVRRQWIRRVFLGSDFVEGTYLNEVRRPSGRFRIGVVTVGYQDRQYSYGGSNYDPDTLEYIGRFSSVLSRASDQSEYGFVYDAQHHPHEVATGVGLLSFDRPSGRHPTRFSGYCIDSADSGGLHLLRGARLSGADEEAARQGRLTPALIERVLGPH